MNARITTLVLGLIVATTSSAFGQTVTNWTGTAGLLNGNWSTGANWATGNAPTSSIDTNLTFGVTTGTTILNMDLSAPFVLNRLTFTTDVNGTGLPAAYTFTGGDFLFSTKSDTTTMPEIVVGGPNAGTTLVQQTINSNVQFNSSLMTLRVDGSNTNGLRIGGSITATGGVVSVLTLTGTSTNAANFVAGNIGEANGSTLSILKDGAGRWELAGTNTIGGGINVNAGTLVFSLTNGTTVNGPIVVAGGNLTFNGATTFNNAATITGGVMVLGHSANVHSGASAFFVEGGILRISESRAINLGNAPLTLGSAANATAVISYTDNTAVTMTRGITMLGTGLLTISSDTTGALTINTRDYVRRCRYGKKHFARRLEYYAHQCDFEHAGQ